MTENRDESSIEEKKKLIIFGRDVSKIPCFRNTFLYSIESGIAAGLLTFLFTSRGQFSSNVGAGVFTITCSSYWIFCRYNYSKTKFEIMRLKAAMQQQVMFEGTEYESKINAEDAKEC